MNDTTIDMFISRTRTILNRAKKQNLVHYEIEPTSIHKIQAAPERELDITVQELSLIHISREGYLYFVGNSMQGLANLLIPEGDFDLIVSRRSHSLKQLGIPIDSLLPLRLGEKALQTFKEYDDLYQIAGAYVSIGKYFNAHGLYSEALDSLGKALECVNHHHLLYYHHDADTLDKLQPFVGADTIFTEMTWIGQERVKTVPE